MTGTWDKYEARYAKEQEAMRKLLAESVSEVEPMNHDCKVEEYKGDTYGFHATVTRSDGMKAVFQLEIWDASDSDGSHEPGEAGNFIVDGSKEGGEILCSFAPENWTDECWAPYEDESRWTAKRKILHQAVSTGLADVVRAFLAYKV